MSLTLPELIEFMEELYNPVLAFYDESADISEVDASKLDPYGPDYDYPEPRYER